jgi:ribosomal protein S18 acetylase RimI-like enzyme
MLKFLNKKGKKGGSQNFNYILRNKPLPEDCTSIRMLLARTGFFSEAEINTGVELVEEKLIQGDRSSYRFIFAEAEKKLLGYTCYGLIPLTHASYDLYWIAVDPDCQGNGIGKVLLSKTEESIRESGGMRVYADTSSRKQYYPTRKFYLSCGYRKAANLPDFYTQGDGKIVFVKGL